MYQIHPETPEFVEYQKGYYNEFYDSNALTDKHRWVVVDISSGKSPPDNIQEMTDEELLLAIQRDPENYEFMIAEGKKCSCLTCLLRRLHFMTLDNIARHHIPIHSEF